MNVIQSALWKLINPIAIVTARFDGKTGGFIASWITQVSFVPPLVMIAVNPLHYTYELIASSNAFAINVLRTNQAELVDLFGKTSSGKVDKFVQAPWEIGRTGSPLLEDCLAFIDCNVVWSKEAGDHVVIVGSIADAGIRSEGETLREVRSMYSKRTRADGSY